MAVVAEYQKTLQDGSTCRVVAQVREVDQGQYRGQIHIEHFVVGLNPKAGGPTIRIKKCEDVRANEDWARRDAGNLAAAYIQGL